jgi:MYXO-CTERM domain-containing protein
VTYSLPSGSTLPLGDRAVTATAEDAAGNRASCSFQVTVRDTTPPALSCPEDVRVSTDESAGTSVTYVLPEPTDLVSSSTVTASPESGSHFPKGETRVTVTATDAAGNAAQCSFNVTVQARQESSGGCGCQADGGGAGAALVVLSALATWAGRRRRRERVTREQHADRVTRDGGSLSG